MKRSVVYRCVAIAAICSFALLVIPLFTSAQNVTQTNKELPVRDLLKLPGKLLTDTKTTGSSGDLKLTGYRVEEVQLPRSLTTDVRGQQLTVDRAWRVTVTGGPFPVRAMPAVIWIDDQIVGYGIENETLTQITAITVDGSLIREDGVVSLSYGENKEGRIRLSQKLQLNREGENQ
ncbi:MAG: hypothetical protein LC794_12365 [Acidobacteria bacterium]|nr:hypothetical protein [Acidobacteriota bacterium]MCA1627463.1 hypothetical protein [Acidobacteriota bacterium]